MELWVKHGPDPSSARKNGILGSAVPMGTLEFIGWAARYAGKEGAGDQRSPQLFLMEGAGFMVAGSPCLRVLEKSLVCAGDLGNNRAWLPKGQELQYPLPPPPKDPVMGCVRGKGETCRNQSGGAVKEACHRAGRRPKDRLYKAKQVEEASLRIDIEHVDSLGCASAETAPLHPVPSGRELVITLAKGLGLALSAAQLCPV